MSCFFKCKIKWEDKVREMDIISTRTIHGVVIGNPVEYVKKFQQGVCSKCGKIYRREVNIEENK